MKSFAVASVILAAAAVAQPHGHQHQHQHRHHDKRAIVTEVQWVTETQYVTKLVDSTTTVWVSSGHKAPSTTSEEAKFIESKAPTTTTTSSTSIYTPPPPPTTTSTTSIAPPPPPPVTTSSTYVPPPPPPPPKTTTAAPPPAKKKPVQAPVEQQPTVAQPAPTTSVPSSGGGGGGSYSGDITYFTIGRGSCGDDDSGQDNSIALVALSAELMASYQGANPNQNTKCGSTITISANGKSTTAIVKDTCPECALGSIDVSEKVFNDLFGGLGKGRGQCTWSFN
ncbi:hypothetical protein BGZ63DRAFT_398762 [Mariannaea sp. PMI_226]|nr:hypothetical protein BGZ63DRAFT_398762 [Mariannaea sp. PMI_226]